jgi:hypothetical protein
MVYFRPAFLPTSTEGLCGVGSGITYHAKTTPVENGVVEVASDRPAWNVHFPITVVKIRVLAAVNSSDPPVWLTSPPIREMPGCRGTVIFSGGEGGIRSLQGLDSSVSYR